MRIHTNGNLKTIKIYTDGSSNTQCGVGAWASIILIDDKKSILSETIINTTHNRMELMAVIKGVEYVNENYEAPFEIEIISDSQYVVGLTKREVKFIASDFITKKGNEIRNADLVKEFLELILNHTISFTKIKAHQKKGGNADYNIEADKLCRKLVRQTIRS